MNEAEKIIFRDIYNFVYETAAAKSVPDCKAVMDAAVTMYRTHHDVSLTREISTLMERARGAV